MTCGADNNQTLEIQGLQKIFRGNAKKGHDYVRAVDNVDLTVSEGELLVLLGPSGCGKTTLLRSIAGLEKPDAGEIKINGRTVFSAKTGTYVPPEERRIGMMFQSYALWPHMTVYQNVAYPLSSNRGDDKRDIDRRVSDQLHELDVGGLEHRYPGELSGGQQQRVALARALIDSPSLILFDEPLSNVDAKVRRRLRGLLSKLKQKTSFAGVYVTHDQEEAMELADTLAVMENGQIRQRATSHEVYNRPSTIYVADFVGEINRWRGEVIAAQNDIARVKTAFSEFTVENMPGDAYAGTKGWLTIRPERVFILPLDAEATTPGDRFRGKVRKVIYFGTRFEFQIDIDDTNVMVWMPDSTGDKFVPRVGEDVDVILPKDSIQWLIK